MASKKKPKRFQEVKWPFQEVTWPRKKQRQKNIFPIFLSNFQVGAWNINCSPWEEKGRPPFVPQFHGLTSGSWNILQPSNVLEAALEPATIRESPNKHRNDQVVSPPLEFSEMYCGQRECFFREMSAHLGPQKFLLTKRKHKKTSWWFSTTPCWKTKNVDQDWIIPEFSGSKQILETCCETTR